jgi:hypothetical protein
VHPEPFVEGGGLHTAASGKGCLGQHHDTLRVSLYVFVCVCVSLCEHVYLGQHHDTLRVSLYVFVSVCVCKLV